MLSECAPNNVLQLTSGSLSLPLRLSFVVVCCVAAFRKLLTGSTVTASGRSLPSHRYEFVAVVRRSSIPGVKLYYRTTGEQQLEGMFRDRLLTLVEPTSRPELFPKLPSQPSPRRTRVGVLRQSASQCYRGLCAGASTHL